MRKTASWFGSLRPTEYKVAARLFVRHQRAPLDTPSSRPQRACCRARSCQGVAWHRRVTRRYLSDGLDSPCARQRLGAAGQGEETGFQVEQRNRSEGKNACRVNFALDLRDIHARPASEKRQGTKSRWIGHR